MVPAIIAAAAAVIAAIWLFAVFPGRPGKNKKAPFDGLNIAHRGLYDNGAGVPENSLAAFEKAAEHGYGIELDVQLSRDGEVVVFHDDTLGRVCSVNARVDELDMSELSSLALCGGPERIPTFSRVLELVGGRVPLLVELKHGRRDKELCEKTLELLRGYKGVYCIESFDPRIVGFFRKSAPDIMRGQLSQPASEFKKFGFSFPANVILGHLLLNFIARPEFISYRIGKKPFPVRFAERCGAMRFGWTSIDESAEKDFDSVIFEHYRPRVRFR